MSAGNYLDAFYTSDLINVHPIRIQPETAALVIDGVTNTIPAGPADFPISAKVSGGKRQLGLTARSVTVKWTTTPPTGYDDEGEITLPWLDPTTWLGLAKEQTGTYLTQGVTVVRKTQEFSR